MANQEIETVFHPGQATTMLGMLKYPDDFSRAHGLNQLWAKDTAATAVVADNTGFAIRQAYLIKNQLQKEPFRLLFHSNTSLGSVMTIQKLCLDLNIH